MDHKLRVLVRLDADPADAVLHVSGCLTADSCRALPPLVREAAALVDGNRITVDLTKARHIEREAVAFLRSGTDFGKSGLMVKCPDPLPQCPARKPSHRRNQPTQEFLRTQGQSVLSLPDLPADPLDTETLAALPLQTLQALTDRVFHQLDSDFPSAYALEWYSALSGEWARRTEQDTARSTTQLCE
ncbi:hypothetical protein [Arthrobacter gengyunqii]|uniref:STAS domain-containing protein n=1 Tax=Arthrobacter gengyunqii TaxID=2886940 RepID=A0ABS8GL96_9MICC|nr:hypothetical protein [Arthrobacter gengyunqii]MCC3267216.1 hypothetical protein [Arthrobacter gengyunqii]